tara:strand:+ start:11742 stop:11915 length:174 start_codon:yes stop_codon:yes gene_type:complete
MQEIPERPKFPIISLTYETDLRDRCKKCDSSLKRKWWFKVLGCVHPECEDYYEKNNV